MKPILKWAGGKTQLLHEIRERMPETYNRYYEPFFGGGAVYFNLMPENAVVNDKNRQLINCYIQVRDNLQQLLVELDNHTINHNEEYYYKIREMYNSRMKNSELTYEDAGMMLYLNKAGFNGMYRENKNGYFNIPSGKKKSVMLYDSKNIHECSEQLVNTELRNLDFEEACKDAQKGDFVFFDSPYYKTFDTYQAKGFTIDDHERLAKLFKELTDKGVYCMLTNSNEEYVKDLYRDYNIDVVDVRRMINWGGQKKIVQEVIITNYEK